MGFPLVFNCCVIRVLLVVLLTSSGVMGVTVWTEREEASFLEEGHLDEASISSYPIVNKCCALGQRWRVGGGCVPSPPETSSLDMMEKVKGVILIKDQGKNDAHSTSSHAFIDAPVVFRLRVSMPNCSSSKKMIEKIIQKEVLRRERMLNVSEVFNWPESPGGANETTSVFLSTEGHLIWRDSVGLMNMHRYNHFCIDQINETAFIALICEPRCDAEQPCIRKCCSPGNILDIDNSACAVSRNEWTPFLYDSNTYEPLDPARTQNTHYIYGITECDSYSFTPRQDPADKMYILTNGSLMTITRGRTVIYPTDTFCVDGSAEHLTHAPNMGDGPHLQEPHEPVYFGGSELDQIAIICYPPITNVTKQDWRYGVYAKCELVSSFFLVLTALVYLILWEYQNIHGWLQFAYVGSCFFSFTFLAIVQLFTNQINDFDQNLCESLGAIIHFSFLAAFFWLTSMNFDLWWTFSGCRPLRPSSKTGDKKRFVIFAIFSWGFPGIIAGIGLALDFIYEDQPNSGVIRPRFGERKCYFYGSEEQLPYFYGPVGVLLLVDLIFFINTVYSLQKLQQDTKFATRQSSKQDKKRFVLFMKIFIVMGVLWIFEVISWIVEVYSGNENMKNAFIPFDIINALQGLWIFIIFTCKPNTCRQLEGKFKKLSIFLERNRDQETPEMRGSGGISFLRSIVHCFLLGIFACLLPIVYTFRRLFSACGHRRMLSESQRTRTNTITVTSGTFDKSRKFSDCSTASTYTTTDPSSSYEMDPKTSRTQPI